MDSIVLSNNELNNKNHFSKHAIIEIVKGLTGEGVSFKINKNNEDYYLTSVPKSDEIIGKIMENSSEFKKGATFYLDLKYVLKKKIRKIYINQKRS